MFLLDWTELESHTLKQFLKKIASFRWMRCYTENQFEYQDESYHTQDLLRKTKSVFFEKKGKGGF